MASGYDSLMQWMAIPRASEIAHDAHVDHFRARVWGRPSADCAWNRDDLRADSAASLSDVLEWACQQEPNIHVEVFAVLTQTPGLRHDAEQLLMVRIYGSPPPDERGGETFVITADHVTQ